MRAFAVFLVSLAVAVATAWLTLEELTAASVPHKAWVLVAVVAVSVGTAAGGTGNLYRSVRSDYFAKFERAALQAAGLAYAALAESCSLRPAHIGLSAYAVRRTLRCPVRGELHRMALLRETEQASSGIRWSYGKGVIGRCWKEKKFTQYPTAALWAPYAQYTKTQWKGLSSAVTMGLKWEEWQSIKDRYIGVVAYPVITEKKRLRGVVALDGSQEHVEWEQLDAKSVRDVLSLASGRIARSVV